MWYCEVLIPGYSAAIALKRSSQYGMVMEMPLDLVALVTCFFARLLASSKAKRMMRSQPRFENTEGEYSSIGGRMYPGSEREIVMQETVMSRVGVDRVLKFAFELARTRPKRHLTSATKSNGIAITMPYWDERVEAMAKKFPEVNVDKFHIDILTAHFVQRPDFFDVVVASNLFGDILSDLGPACTGTIGIAPSANLDPERRNPSLFEPVHGSAPDIYGKQIANPIGQIWCGAMMLEFLGHKDAHDAILRAIENVLDPESGAPKTPDLGGKGSTTDLGRAIAELI